MGSDPDILVDLTTAKSDFEAQIIVESLEAQGIPARAFTTAGSVLPLDLGSTQPFRIAVRRRDVNTARTALQAIRAESVDIDWDEVDVGEGESAPILSSTLEPRRRRWRAVTRVTLFGVCAIVLGNVLYTAAIFLVHRYSPSLLDSWTSRHFLAMYFGTLVACGLAIALAARRGG